MIGTKHNLLPALLENICREVLKCLCREVAFLHVEVAFNEGTKRNLGMYAYHHLCNMSFIEVSKSQRCLYSGQ